MRFASMACCFCLVLGCSNGDWGRVSGNVTLDGKSLNDATITFHPEKGGAAAYGQVVNGSFTIQSGQQEGLVIGKYKVTVSAMTIPEPGSKQTSKMLTPVIYSRPDSTTLSADVKAGSNSFTFDLSSKK